MSELKGKYMHACEVEELVRKFESCELADSDFNHGAHLTVALFYVSSLTVEEALERMREGLFRFLDHYDVDRQKYNETITVFWIRVVHSFLDGRNPGHIADLTNELVEKHGDAKIIFKHYSKELLMSEEARRRWVEPDLRKIDF